jgi:hypothetical protein
MRSLVKYAAGALGDLNVAHLVRLVSLPLADLPPTTTAPAITPPTKAKAPASDVEPDESCGCPLYLLPPTTRQDAPTEAKAREGGPVATDAPMASVERPRPRGYVVGVVGGGKAGELILRASRDPDGHALLVLCFRDREGEEIAGVVLGKGSAVRLAGRLLTLLPAMGARPGEVERAGHTLEQVPLAWATPPRSEPRPPRREPAPRRHGDEPRARGVPPSSWRRATGRGDR